MLKDILLDKSKEIEHLRGFVITLEDLETLPSFQDKELTPFRRRILEIAHKRQDGLLLSILDVLQKLIDYVLKHFSSGDKVFPFTWKFWKYPGLIRFLFSLLSELLNGTDTRA